MSISTFFKFKNKIVDIVEKVLTIISIIFTYFLGIGFSAVVSRLFGTVFLKNNFLNSSWEVVEKKELNTKKMY